jgi:hypothetical protein
MPAGRGLSGIGDSLIVAWGALVLLVTWLVKLIPHLLGGVWFGAEAVWKALTDNSLVRQGRRSVTQAYSTYLLPKPQLLRDEVIQLEIRQAWYRHVVPGSILRYWWLVMLLTVALMAAVGYWASQSGTSPFLALIVLLISLAILIWAIQETLCYNQWRLLITNRRTIIFMPDPRAWLRVDNIRLQAGKIQVVDVNFSSSWWWGIFQSLTGGRDLVISLSGYEFKPNSAEIKGGLVFPDVMPEDVAKLEEIVFPKK